MNTNAPDKQDDTTTTIKNQIRTSLRLVSLPAVIASLCCLAPVILVMFGLASAAFAASLADVFYGNYAWVFRSVGLVLVLISLYLYITRTVGICTIDEVVRQRNKIINIVALTLSLAVIVYAVFLYGFVELLGLGLGIW